MQIIVGLLLLIIFTFLAVLHFYWGLGGRWGAGAAVPSKANGQKELHPKITSSFVVAFGLLFFAAISLAGASLLFTFFPGWLVKYGLWVIAVVFLLRAIGEFKYVGFFKKIKSTTFGKADTKYFSPLCLAIAILSLVLQLLN